MKIFLSFALHNRHPVRVREYFAPEKQRTSQPQGRESTQQPQVFGQIAIFQTPSLRWSARIFDPGSNKSALQAIPLLGIGIAEADEPAERSQCRMGMRVCPGVRAGPATVG